MAISRVEIVVIDAVDAERALELPAHRLVERRYGIAAARDGFRELMSARPAPTAIVCGNDVLAFGALLEARRMNIDVPKSVSLVGFDDLELANQVDPALTTVHVPAEEMWNAAADRLLAALCGDTAPRRTEIEVSLVVRGSTAPAPVGSVRSSQLGRDINRT